MTKNKSMIEDLFNKGVRQTYKKDEVIVNAFEEPSGVYLIEKGHIKSYSITDRGDVNIQLIRASGDIFPLLWALGKHNRDIYFAAMDDVTVCRISASEFAAKIEGDDYLQREMTERLIDVYMLLSERVRNLEQRRAKDRLVYCLESLAGRFGKKVGNKTIVQAPIHHHDIADMINTSRETTSREFVLLEKAGKVGYHNKQIVLFD